MPETSRRRTRKKVIASVDIDVSQHSKAINVPSISRRSLPCNCSHQVNTRCGLQYPSLLQAKRDKRKEKYLIIVDSSPYLVVLRISIAPSVTYNMLYVIKVIYRFFRLFDFFAQTCCFAFAFLF